MPDLHFGWVVPVEDSSGRGSQPLLLSLEKESLAAITRRFDSLWVYDHFYGIAGCKWPRTPADDQAWLDKLGALVELGFSHFMLDCGTFESPELVERFVEQVMAPLRDRA